MSPKTQPPPSTKTRKTTTRPKALLKLAELLDALLSRDLVLYDPWMPVGGESGLFKLKVEQAEKELVQLIQKTMEALQDSLALVEEDEAVDIMAVVDRFNICVRRFDEAHSGPCYSDELEAYRDRLKELAARLRVRAEKMREGRVGVMRPRRRRTPKKHKPISIKDAALICGVSPRTIKNWEAGKHTPEGWPGRDDVFAMRSFAMTKKSRETTKRGLKNMLRGGTIQHLCDQDEEERREAWSKKDLNSL